MRCDDNDLELKSEACAPIFVPYGKRDYIISCLLCSNRNELVERLEFTANDGCEC